MPKKYIEIGQAVGTHGIRGELRVNTWCDTPDFFIQFKTVFCDNEGKEKYKVTASRTHGNVCLVKLLGVDTIEQAEKFRGRVLFVDRDECTLSKGQYFITDIIGCKVFDFEINVCYGEVVDVSQTGANDVWHIEYNGRECLIPNVPEYVKKVDIDLQKIYITAIKGTFEDED